MAKSLTSAIKAYVSELEAIKQDLVVSYQMTLYEIGELLVYYTPIDTGLASSNWNVSSGERTEPERGVQDGAKGAASLEAISYQVKGLENEPMALFYNPVDYIDDLEGGYSRQAPSGMVTPTLTQIDDIWEANLKQTGLM